MKEKIILTSVKCVACEAIQQIFNENESIVSTFLIAILPHLIAFYP